MTNYIINLIEQKQKRIGTKMPKLKEEIIDAKQMILLLDYYYVEKEYGTELERDQAFELISSLKRRCIESTRTFNANIGGVQ